MVRLISKMRKLVEAPKRRPIHKKGYPVGRAYQARDKLLRSLGFRSYGEYLGTQLWHSIRERVLRNRKTCGICDKAEPRCVHHEYYTRSNLLGKTTAGLVPLCMACHRKIEFSGDGRKRTATEAQETLWRLLKRRRRHARKARRVETSRSREPRPVGTATSKGNKPEHGRINPEALGGRPWPAAKP